jgi:hypothetical protein
MVATAGVRGLCRVKKVGVERSESYRTHRQLTPFFHILENRMRPRGVRLVQFLILTRVSNNTVGPLDTNVVLCLVFAIEEAGAIQNSSVGSEEFLGVYYHMANMVTKGCVNQCSHSPWLTMSQPAN